MKRLLFAFVFLFSAFSVFSQINLGSETAVESRDGLTGVPLNRVAVDHPLFGMKYDYTRNLKTLNTGGIISLTLKKMFQIGNDSNYLRGTGFIAKLGNSEINDELIADLTLSGENLKFGINYYLEYGRVFGAKSRPWDYILGRFGSRLFTIEGGILSSAGPLSKSDKKNLYGWVAFHPKKFFVTVGNEVTRTWVTFGNKQMKNFATFTVANYDRENGNFWMRTQFGVGNPNLGFYCQDNYITATSYLIVPPFHYIHFSPVSTKGTYGIRIDMKKTGLMETYELNLSRQFGRWGNLTLGVNLYKNNGLKKIGPTFEYYKTLKLWHNLQLIAELRYDYPLRKFAAFFIVNMKLL